MNNAIHPITKQTTYFTLKDGKWFTPDGIEVKEILHDDGGVGCFVIIPVFLFGMAIYEIFFRR